MGEMRAERITRIPAILRRGFSHILVGLSIGISAIFIPRVIYLSLLGMATVTFLLLEFIRFKSPVVNRWFCSFFRLVLRESEAMHLTGASYMLLAALISFLVFTRDIAVASVCFLAMGDAMATIIGRNNGNNGKQKTKPAGHLACLAACLAVGFILRCTGLDISIPAVVIGAIVATIAEAIPLPVNDNLTIPLFAGLAMTLIELFR
ncbi:MAG: hypothetical protein PHY28_03140 [Dehalococcoidales bacterium]|nr:hypothetical protein [Dehalococcoidales bacterium]